MSDKKDQATNGETPAPRVTKTELLRTAFDEQPAWSKEDLIARTGYDAANLNTAIGLLRRADRTKDPIDIRYNKKTNLYTVSHGAVE